MGGWAWSHHDQSQYSYWILVDNLKANLRSNDRFQTSSKQKNIYFEENGNPFRLAWTALSFTWANKQFIMDFCRTKALLIEFNIHPNMCTPIRQIHDNGVVFMKSPWKPCISEVYNICSSILWNLYQISLFQLPAKVIVAAPFL